MEGGGCQGGRTGSGQAGHKVPPTSLALSSTENPSQYGRNWHSGPKITMKTRASETYVHRYSGACGGRQAAQGIRTPSASPDREMRVRPASSLLVASGDRGASHPPFRLIRVVQLVLYPRLQIRRAVWTRDRVGRDCGCQVGPRGQVGVALSVRLGCSLTRLSILAQD